MNPNLKSLIKSFPDRHIQTTKRLEKKNLIKRIDIFDSFPNINEPFTSL